MKTTERSREARVILKDGATYLATWTQNFRSLPLPGEEIRFPGHVSDLGHLSRFRTKAKVVRVQDGDGVRHSFIEMEAEPKAGYQRAVTLNAGMIPASYRMDAERIVRQGVPDTRIIWEDSLEPSAVLRMRTSSGVPTTGPGSRPSGVGPGDPDQRAARKQMENRLRQLVARSRQPASSL